MSLAALFLIPALTLPPLSPPLHQCGVRLFEEFRLPANDKVITQVLDAVADRDPEVTKALLVVGMIESKLNVKARGAAGEVGAFQIMPGTATWLMKHCRVKGKLADPAVNARLAHCYLEYLLDKSNGSLMAAIASYNAGEGVLPKIQRYENIPGVTAQYIWKFNRLYRRIEGCEQ